MSAWCLDFYSVCSHVIDFYFVESLPNFEQLIYGIPDLSGLMFKYISNKAKKYDQYSDQGNG